MGRNRKIMVSAVAGVLVMTAAAVPAWRDYQAEEHREQVSTLLLQACLDLAVTTDDTNSCLDKYAAR